MKVFVISSIITTIIIMIIMIIMVMRISIVMIINNDTSKSHTDYNTKRNVVKNM